ncbi:MAG: GNAT family N-acetyltransferase [Proteobacteria bacterium]|nr:GNAT family N-acetyltransferase [Pseudomonadota bacterium]
MYVYREIYNNDEDLIKQITDLYNRVYGGEYHVSTQMLIDKHLKNPFGEKVCGAVAVDGKKVIAATFFLSGQYLYNRMKYKAALGCDYLVDPDYQRKGLGTGLTSFMESYFISANYDFLCTFPNIKSKASFLRNAWKEVFVFDYFIMPCMGPAFMNDLFLWQKIKGFSNKLRSLSDIKIEKGDINIITPDDYALINNMTDKVTRMRSKDVYNYKFNDNYYKHYYIKITKKNETKFICTIRIDIRKIKGINLRFLDIVDWHSLCDNKEDSAKYFARVLCEARNLGDAIVLWQSTDRVEQEIISNDFGFFNMSSLKVNKSEHYFLTKKLNASMSDNIEKAENWKLRWIETDL